MLPFTFLRSKRCVAAFVSTQISRYPILLGLATLRFHSKSTDKF